LFLVIVLLNPKFTLIHNIFTPPDIYIDPLNVYKTQYLHRDGSIFRFNLLINPATTPEINNFELIKYTLVLPRAIINSNCLERVLLYCIFAS